MTVSPSSLMPQLIVLVGAPGSGKTQWAHAHVASQPKAKWSVVSQAPFHAAHTGNEQAYSQFLNAIGAALTTRRHVIADGVFLHENERGDMLRMARQARYLVKEAVLFTVEPEVALRRYMASEQERQARWQPAFHYDEAAIRQAIRTLEQQPPRLSEGFTAILDGKSGGIKQPRTEILTLSHHASGHAVIAL